MGVGDEVRDARLAAGLSQRALAQRAGVPLSTVGRIERGITMPRFDTLTAIAEALGRELHISFRPRLPSWLESLRPQLQEVCLSFGARNLAVFGSVADGTDDAHSDLDLLVDLPPGRDLARRHRQSPRPDSPWRTDHTDAITVGRHPASGAATTRTAVRTPGGFDRQRPVHPATRS